MADETLQDHNAEKRRLLDKYAKEVAVFREFCITHGGNDAFEETDFDGVALGFFFAQGVFGDSGTGDDYYDAFMLATITRYDLQYWEGQKL